MATNKKAVLIYADWIHTVEKLSEEEAGRIFKHLLRYVNDQNPEAPDRLTEITFEPWKQTMKRDLKKWEGEKERFSIAGKASAASRAKKKTDIVVTSSEPTITIPSLKPGEKVKITKKKPEPVIQDEKRNPNELINLAPFDESFRPNWQRWITYKRVEYNTKYKRLDTEQAQFKHLVDLAGRNPVIAAKIIEQSIVGTWKGFFKLKQDEGTQKTGGHSNASNNTGRIDKFSNEYERQFGSEDSGHEAGTDDGPDQGIS